MGLIKKYQIENKGDLQLEKMARPAPRRIARPEPVRIHVSDDDLPQARSEAEKIVNEAIAEAEAIREEARETGRHEGMGEAAARIDEALETLNQAVVERKKIIKDAENEILRLSLKIAEQVIRSEVSLHRDVSLNIVAEAIARVSDREQIIVRVNREDAEYLKRYKDRLSSMLDGVKSFSIIEDASVEPGGCVIETNLGFIDARIATKLKSIEEALKKVSAEAE